MENDQYIGMMLDDRYEILERIGTGGMAVVYKARCHRLNRFVAVKILKSDFAEDEEFRRRFHAESQAVAMLSHPNIVSVYDVNTWKNIDYIVMELIEGITLKQYIKRKGMLNWRETLHFSTQIVDAMSHAHSRGIIHRDIKPHNIMVLKDGSVKVADFGIARLLSTQNTMTKEALGSVHYISPEQAKGEPVDARSDIYSLGVVMYEMLTGRLPFEGDTAVAIAIQHISSIPLMPGEINSEVPAGIEDITMHAMEPNPDRRYSSAEEMLVDLEDFRKDPSMTFGYTLFSQPSDSAAEPTGRIEKGSDEKGRQSTGGIHRIRGNAVSDRKRASRTSLLVGIFCVFLFLIVMFMFLWSYFLRDMFDPAEDRVAIPDFRGEIAEAVMARDNYSADYKFEVVNVYHDGVEAGRVVSQEPEGGREISSGKDGVTITLTVSLGDEVIKMPDVLNTDYREAKVTLKQLGLDLVFDCESVNDDNYTVGYVMEQEPEIGTALKRGQTIHLTYSKGPLSRYTKVPDVLGYSENRAITKLQNANLSYAVQYSESSQKEGTVIYQSVDSGKSVQEHSQITITVAKGAGPAKVETSGGENSGGESSVEETPGEAE